MAHKKRTSNIRKEAIKKGFRSGLELLVATKLQEAGIAYSYEPFKIPFKKPKVRCFCDDCGSKKIFMNSTYLPDFILTDNILLEPKGIFSASDRAKMVTIKSIYEDEVVMVFQQPNMKLTKKSKETYGSWCDKHDIKWCTVDTLIATIEKIRRDGKRK